MGDRVASAKALGFGAFGIVAWMYSMFDTGWFTPEQAGGVAAGVGIFASTALLVAALASFLRGETWHAVFFMLWSAFVHGYGATMQAGAAGPSPYEGWYSALIALISLMLFMAAQRMGAGMPVVLLSLGATLAFVGFALAGWLGGGIWLMLGGYLGLATGLAALWATYAEMGSIGAGGGSAA